MTQHRRCQTGWFPNQVRWLVLCNVRLGKMALGYATFIDSYSNHSQSHSLGFLTWNGVWVHRIVTDLHAGNFAYYGGAFFSSFNILY